MENGDEKWLVFANFDVIMRYNPRIIYAMTVYQLSQALQNDMTNKLLERAIQQHQQGSLKTLLRITIRYLRMIPNKLPLYTVRELPYLS